MADVIRVLLLQEHELVRRGIRLVLEQDPFIRVLAEAGDRTEAVISMSRLEPDIVVVDVVSGGDLETIRAIRDEFPYVRVLAVSQYAEREFVDATLEAGADAYVLKQGPWGELLGAVRSLHRGEVALCRARARASARVAPEPAFTHPSDMLSRRERQILTLVAAGHTSKAIAHRLGLSPRTVGNHRARIMDKLRAASCAEAVAQALRNGSIALTPLEKDEDMDQDLHLPTDGGESGDARWSARAGVAVLSQGSGSAAHALRSF